MLYWLSYALEDHFGPFRLLRSHAFLIALGTFLASFFTWFMLPKLWHLMPKDKGKAILGKDGMKSEGKPTGAGAIVTLLTLPAIIIAMPLSVCDIGVVLFLYAAMAFGFLDDASSVPWGQLRKGLLDAGVSIGAAVFLYAWHGSEIWVPFFKGVWTIPWWIYIPGAGFLIWFTMNATNCSDGVDGLAGTLTLIALVMLAVVLYAVVGYRPVAHYFLIPVYAEAARWAIVVMVVAGAFSGYLWYNAEPSKILMGDAGSRFLGILVATASLMTGNPLLVLFLSPVVLVNGGGGLGKLVLLRVAKRLGFQIGDDSVIRKVRFPLHDHCKKNLGWSNAQVLMRFVLLQLALVPILLMVLIKVR